MWKFKRPIKEILTRASLVLTLLSIVPLVGHATGDIHKRELDKEDITEIQQELEVEVTQEEAEVEDVKTQEDTVMKVGIRALDENKGVTSTLIQKELTFEPVEIKVSSIDKGDLESIKMVGSPKKGKNYAINSNTEIKSTGYEVRYSIRDWQELENEDITVSFEAQTLEVGEESVLNTLILGGESYPIDEVITNNPRRITYTIPKQEFINEEDRYDIIRIKRGRLENIAIRDMKIEVGETETPYTLEPEEVGFTEVVNLFDKDEWLNTTPAQKPKTTGVPYIDYKLKPFTEYTMSTNIPTRGGENSYFDVFVMPTSEAASSEVNGVSLDKPRTVKTLADGIVRVAMRDYDGGISSGKCG